jgi:anti-sigma factor (TIGR02949 family)
MIDCREAVRRMWAYLEHELALTREAEFEAHLETCQRCCGELEFSRSLRAMVAEKDDVAVPPQVRARIETLLATDDRPAEGRA